MKFSETELVTISKEYFKYPLNNLLTFDLSVDYLISNPNYRIGHYVGLNRDLNEDCWILYTESGGELIVPSKLIQKRLITKIKEFFGYKMSSMEMLNNKSNRIVKIMAKSIRPYE